MKIKGITSIDDEKMEEVMDELNIDSDRFSQLLPLVSKKISGK
jgi:hypothetical protein